MYSSITASDIKGMIGKINIIDIRENYLYRLGSIPTSKNIPLSYLDMSPEKYLKKDEKYYIYCALGMKSPKLCNKLSNLGYNIVNILGGYNEYISK